MRQRAGLETGSASSGTSSPERARQHPSDLSHSSIALVPAVCPCGVWSPLLPDLRGASAPRFFAPGKRLRGPVLSLTATQALLQSRATPSGATDSARDVAESRDCPARAQAALSLALCSKPCGLAVSSRAAVSFQGERSRPPDEAVLLRAVRMQALYSALTSLCSVEILIEDRSRL